MIIVWLPTAIRNRDDLIEYIAKENPTAAIGQDQLIETRVAQLENHPGLGRAGRKQGTRELVISRTSFVVIYRVKPKAKRIEILRVLHSSQQWPR